MDYEVFTHPPQGFQPLVEIVGCHCEWSNKFLLAKRHPNKSQGNFWAVPGGKIEPQELPRNAVIREIKEEVGLDINDESLIPVGKLYFRLPYLDYTYHMFRKPFDTLPQITLELEENIDIKWVTIEEALQMPLIAGGIDALHFYKKNLHPPF